MTIAIVILMLAVLIAVDYVVREVSQRMREGRDRRQREEVLNTSVRLDFSEEAKSLKRVEVAEPLARILAVDDEAVVLDSFRKILVLDGFNVDTVESGPEALGLIRRHDYDFVFTDLKMPEMDGVEVVKAVKHLRPDIDVVVITGYGTIETAVQTLQHGACEYVQKPFTAGELSDFARKLLIKRDARLEAQRRPVVRIVSPAVADASHANEFCVPGGVFVGPGHAWARIEPSGQVRIGIDDFTRKALGTVEAVVLPETGKEVKAGDMLFSLKQGSETVRVLAPLTGKVLEDNARLKRDAALLNESPYENGWVCLLQPTDLAGELSSLRIGIPVVNWYQEEILRWRQVRSEARKEGGAGEWTLFQQQFLTPTSQPRV